MYGAHDAVGIHPAFHQIVEVQIDVLVEYLVEVLMSGHQHVHAVNLGQYAHAAPATVELVLASLCGMHLQQVDDALYLRANLVVRTVELRNVLAHWHVFGIHDGVVPAQLKTLAAAVEDADVFVGHPAGVVQWTAVLV